MIAIRGSSRLLRFVISVTLVTSAISQDLSNLGITIENAVREGLAPLNNLGPLITKSVYGALRPVQQNKVPGRTYDSPYSGNMFSNQFMNRPFDMFGQDGLNELDGLGESISSGVYNQLKPLDNLGQQIEQNVYQALEPVRALQVTASMKKGVGGTTVVTYLPAGKQFIMKNSVIFECEGGTIDDITGQCSGRLVPYEGKDLKDKCYHLTSYSIVNDNICLGANSVSVINDKIICRKADGSPAVLMKGEDFRRLCQGVAETAVYKYIANEQDVNHVQIPNPNKYVKCESNQPGVCIFREKLPFPIPGVSGRSVFVNA